MVITTVSEFHLSLCQTLDRVDSNMTLYLVVGIETSDPQTQCSCRFVQPVEPGYMATYNCNQFCPSKELDNSAIYI